MGWLKQMGKMEEYQIPPEGLRCSLKCFGNAAPATNKTETCVEFLQMSGQEGEENSGACSGLELGHFLNHRVLKEREKRPFSSSLLYTGSYLFFFFK